MLGQRLAGRDAEAQAPRAVLRRAIGIVQHGGVERRHAEEDRRLLALHHRKHRLRRRPLVEERGGGADRHREGHGVAEAVGEEELCGRIDDVVLGDAEHALAVEPGRLDQARMDVLDALRHPGRARRVEPEGDLVGASRGRLGGRCSRRQEIVQPRVLRARLRSRDDDFHAAPGGGDRGFDGRQQRRRDHDERGAGVLEHIGVLVGPQKRVQRHRDDPGPDRAPEHDREIDRVEHQHHDAMLGRDAERGERRADAARLVVELAIGERAPRVAEGDLLRPALRQVAVDERDGGVVALGHASSRTRRRRADAPGLPRSLRPAVSLPAPASASRPTAGIRRQAHAVITRGNPFQGERQIVGRAILPNPHPEVRAAGEPRRTHPASAAPHRRCVLRGSLRSHLSMRPIGMTPPPGRLFVCGRPGTGDARDSPAARP